MHAQLQRLTGEFEHAQLRLHSLADAAPVEYWGRRPQPERWSMAECVAHLNLTSEAYLPLLRNALDQARLLGRVAPKRYRRDFLGWVLWKTLGPPVRFRVKTTAPFVPSSTQGHHALIAAFDRLQAEQIALVQEADGLPLSQARITSPFDGRLTYNAYTGFSILARHQERHIWQAEQVWQEVRTRGYEV